MTHPEPASSGQCVVTFYRFQSVDDPSSWRDAIYEQADTAGLVGTVLLAEEGINGTLAGTPAAVGRFGAWLRTLPGLEDLRTTVSNARAGSAVFRKLRVVVKSEIVRFGRTLGAGDRVGTHAQPDMWEALLADPEVTVLDVRNDYEVAIGSFPGAVNPGTTNFREFAAFVREKLDPARNRKIAMFCTGGVRCEKASSFLLECGFDDVHQLDGGILGYLAARPDGGAWQGECFVFDQRVSVNAALDEGAFEQCFACRHPLSTADRSHPGYQPGVSCPHCIASTPAERRVGFAERVRQVALAAERGENHLADRLADRLADQDGARVPGESSAGGSGSDR